MNSKEALKNRIAMELISDGKEDFLGEQDIASTLLNEDSKNIFYISIDIYTIAVKKFLEKRKFKQALKWLDYALAFRKDYYQAYFRKGEAFGFLNEYKKAVEYYTKGISLYNKNKDPNKSIYDLAWGYIGRAICYIKLKDYKMANKDMLFAKSEMFDSESSFSAGFDHTEVDRLARLSLLAQSDDKFAEKLQEMIKIKEEEIMHAHKLNDSINKKLTS